MKPSARRRALGPLALVSILGAALAIATVVSKEFFEHPTPTASVRAPFDRRQIDAATEPFTVDAVEGSAEAMRDGQWYVVRAGDVLSLKDVIRCRKGSRVLLRRGATEVELHGDGDVRLDEAAAKIARFGLLRGGKVVASVPDSDQRVQFTANEAQAVNVGAARFVVSLAAGGAVSVASTRGDVRFAARGKEVAVRAGMESTAAPGQPPSHPELIPEDLLLSVIWPELTPSAGAVPVTGKARPSSRVTVNGVEAPVDGDGNFRAQVPMEVGPNRVQVRAEDISGRKKSVEKTLKRPPPAPVLQQANEELWKR